RGASPPPPPAAAPAIANARASKACADVEDLRRAALRFPPWSRLTALRIQGTALAKVEGAAERLAARAREAASRGERIHVLGPAPAPIARLRGKERLQVLLRADAHAPLHRLARALLSERL